MRIISSILVILLLGCAKEEEELIIDDSYGDRVVSISRKGSSNTIKDSFLYVNGSLSIIRETGTDVRFTYENGRLRSINSVSHRDSILYAIDSIDYDDQGRMNTVAHFALDTNNQFKLNHKLHFEYNSNGQIITQSSYSSQQLLRFVRKYKWVNNNVVSHDAFDGQGNLMSEFKYEYDEYHNYLKQDYRYLTSFHSWNENNIARTRIRDHTGLISYICYDCTSKYKYNLDSFPVFHQFHGGKEVTIEYE